MILSKFFDISSKLIIPNFQSKFCLRISSTIGIKPMFSSSFRHEISRVIYRKILIILKIASGFDKKFFKSKNNNFRQSESYYCTFLSSEILKISRRSSPLSMYFYILKSGSEKIQSIIMISLEQILNLIKILVKFFGKITFKSKISKRQSRLRHMRSLLFS